jgi:hypothetical protein
MLVATRWSHHAGKRHGSGRQDAHDMERHIRMVTDAVMCKLRGRQQGHPVPLLMPSAARFQCWSPCLSTWHEAPTS